MGSPIGTFDVLTIDAWNSPDGWTWNDSRVCGSITLDPTADDATIIRAFVDGGFINHAARDSVVVDNDGADPTTIEIQDKETGEPLVAIRVDWADQDAIRKRVVETLLALLEPGAHHRDALRAALKCSPADLDDRLREAREAVETILGD
jgi:hypothetical protein